jgi:dihydromethanopterin reductase (acceptor)
MRSMAKIKTLCFACTLTGSGHFFKEYLRRMVVELDEVDLFVSRAATKVARMYWQEFKLRKTARVFRDTTASAVPVGLL